MSEQILYNVKIQNQTDTISLISIRFFSDILSCELVEKGIYINCSDKESEKIKFKDQDSEEADENSLTSDNSNNDLNINNLSFKN
jgi:hypothetical protein